MYTIGDFLIQIKNAYMANKKTVEYPYAKAVFSIAKILEKEGCVGKVKIKDQKSKSGSQRKIIDLELKYENKVPAISEIKLISKPSVHHYIGKTKISKSLLRNSIGIISTSKGIMTGRQAQKEGVGGELICQIS